MEHKIAGLYVQLAKALNALETAGEDINLPAAEGISALVVKNENGGWTVAEYA